MQYYSALDELKKGNDRTHPAWASGKLVLQKNIGNPVDSLGKRSLDLVADLGA